MPTWRMFGLFCLILVGYELRWFSGCRAQATVRVWDNGRRWDGLYNASRKSVCEGSTFSPAPSSARLQPGGGLQLDGLFQVCQAGQLGRYKGSVLNIYTRPSSLLPEPKPGKEQL